ncbi:MAG TPA: 1-acyl-sn-glycerol-3-phosphate acyltransferase [Pseudomonadales bacterium]|nr:1-acyl-sn-glycerol-3-phosphate acyltransferase [Pseudomonadales bacterium]
MSDIASATQGAAPAADDRFEDIRPYHDDEARPVLDRVLADQEFLSAIARFRFPSLPAWLMPCLKPLVRFALSRETRDVRDVKSFQAVVAKYMRHMISSTTTAFTQSGLEQLEPGRAYLFVSNHRDIAMDPAFVNWALWANSMNTVRIAIGDNLLTKPFASDLMRLNKSFLVRRGETAPKKIYAALKKLSAYIHFSITTEKENVWIAQREGRAKDGLDRTEEAIIKMFAMSKAREQSFADFVRELNIVPVAISYEWDPCDVAKARELYHKATHGNYQKDTHEDVQSIAAGIAGNKGRVHVSFGKVLQADFDSAEAVATEIDRQVLNNYVLFPSNFFAAQALGETVQGVYGADRRPFQVAALAQEKQLFDERLAACPEAYRPWWLAMYANPVRSYRELQQP